MRLFKIVFLVLLMVALTDSSVFAGSRIFDAAKAYHYSSVEYNNYLNKLVAKYPKLLQKEIIGYSTDKRPILALKMFTSYEEADYADKMHVLVEAGTHSREAINTSVVLSMVEDYCIDFYQNEFLAGVDVKKELQDSVLHFIPLSNPDGHDLARFGISRIKNRTALSKISDKNYKRFKANINGVDINRNFPDTHFDGEQWVDLWGMDTSEMTNDKPAGEFYSGPAAGSEIETQILMGYLLRYDFRVVVSYHSTGRMIIYDKPRLSDEFNSVAYRYAQLASKISRYPVIPPSPGTNYGFMSSYFCYNTQKPLITIETTDVLTPTPKAYYGREYKNHNLGLIPIKLLAEARKIGYYPYKVYKDNQYITDFMDISYAEAVAERLGGAVFSYDGKPHYKVEPPVPEPIVESEPELVPQPETVPQAEPAPQVIQPELDPAEGNIPVNGQS